MWKPAHRSHKEQHELSDVQGIMGKSIQVWTGWSTLEDAGSAHLTRVCDITCFLRLMILTSFTHSHATYVYLSVRRDSGECSTLAFTFKFTCQSISIPHLFIKHAIIAVIKLLSQIWANIQYIKMMNFCNTDNIIKLNWIINTELNTNCRNVLQLKKMFRNWYILQH